MPLVPRRPRAGRPPPPFATCAGTHRQGGGLFLAGATSSHPAAPRARRAGPKPHELYGKFTWKIENFSEISKRELRSNVFDVGNYKWCGGGGGGERGCGAGRPLP